MVGANASPSSVEADDYVLSAADHALLEEIERTAFRFFVEQAHPRTGLVRDRARADGSPSKGKASIASSGFAFSAWVIAAERGWVSRDEAVARVRTKLRFLVDEAPRQHGFFYHFMELDTGARAWKCELSSIDSSLLYAGAIVAREYFGDLEITGLVNRLLGDIDWDWFRNGGQLVTLGWHDETGFSRYRWNRYSEHMLMSFLALGTSPRPLEAAYWNRWHRSPVGRYGDFVYLQEPPLFVHQFPQAYLDLRGRRDAFADYFHNSRLATLAQRQFSLDLRREFPAWSETLWGVTASDSANGYKAWGGPPRTLRFNALDGTIVPCAAAGSLPFAPRETLAVLHHLRTAWGDRIWKRYGFADAFNPQTGWVNPDVIGIDQGISLVQAENLRTGLIWRLFMQSPEARLALSKAGILSHSRVLDPTARAALRSHAGTAWRSLQATSASPGLQLTALLAARSLGLLNDGELPDKARAHLLAAVAPATLAEAAQWAAALITLRQVVPALADEASRLLAQIPWNSFPAPAHLGDSARLGVFLQIAAGLRPAADWLNLARDTAGLGPVQVLVPVDVAGALFPGLWLEERMILPGAAASQLAYASVTGATALTDALLPVLQLAHFPSEALPRLPAPATPAAAAASLITIANLLAEDGVHRAFQQDALVQAGRAAIAEFREAAFGANTAVIAQGELDGTPPPPAPRLAVGVPHTQPRDRWHWQHVAGREFLDSEADLRPGDAPLAFRFAFTWDEAALHFHAEVTDTPAGYTVPAKRKRVVELYVDPERDGLVWTGPRDFQFTYALTEGMRETFNHVPNRSRFTPAAEGYSLEASIPWTSLGVTPRPGLELGVSPAVVAAGKREWEALIKLNWSFQPLRAGIYRLGTIRLE
ncbi:MAG: glucoamylase family protein [Verrucomicrobiota bacterium]